MRIEHTEVMDKTITETIEIIKKRSELYGKLTIEYMHKEVHRPGLYFFINDDGKVLRIGKSVSWLLNARIGQYGGYSNAGWGRNITVACICWPHPLDKQGILAVERLEKMFIRKLQPDWNRMGKRSTVYDKVIEADETIAKI